MRPPPAGEGEAAQPLRGRCTSAGRVLDFFLPARNQAAARGETTISVSFVHDVTTEAVNGFPVGSVTPSEGTGAEVGSMSIVKNGPNTEAAKKFYEWALTPGGQQFGLAAKQFQLPSNTQVPKDPRMTDPAKMKLINYDYAKYGASAERRRLIARWEKEVQNAAR